MLFRKKDRNFLEDLDFDEKEEEEKLKRKKIKKKSTHFFTFFVCLN